jgi:hypothetical protein
MQPSKLSIAEQNREQYLIPLFQRGYVWTLTHQVQPLWEDIIDRTDALKEHRDNALKVGGADKLKPLRKHFLGAIVVGSAVSADSEVSWNEKSIIARAEILIPYALRSWPHPASDLKRSV